LLRLVALTASVADNATTQRVDCGQRLRKETGDALRKLIGSLYQSPTGRAVLLFSYLFLVMTSYIAGKSSRDALFLGQFEAIQLPYADIAVAVLVGIIVAAYVRASRFFQMQSLLILSLGAYALTCLVFWWATTRHDAAWLYPIVYVWTGLFGVLATAQVWTLASYIFTTREAKSTFSLIGSGAIAGAIAGGYLAKSFAGRFGAESLLLVMAAALSACIGLVALIWRARSHEPLVEESEDGSHEAGVAAQLQRLWTSPHLRSIALLIGLSSFATTTASWQFKAMAKQAISSTGELASFFGEFNLYAGILALLTQALLTSRLLKRHGIGPALLLVPAALLIGSIGVMLAGTLTAMVLLKGVDQALRHSVDKSSMELLYLPVPGRIKIHAKAFIDTVIWRMGDGLAGIGVLIAARYLHAAPQAAGWMTLGAAILWIAVALMARRTYVGSLRDVVQGWRERTEPTSAAAHTNMASAYVGEPTESKERGLLARSSSAPPFSLAPVDMLDDKELGAKTAEMAIGHGDDAIDALRQRLGDSSTRVTLRMAIVDVLGRIGTRQAKAVLEAALLDGEAQVRQRAAAMLQAVLRNQPAWEADRASVAASLALEISQHYRSYQVLPELCKTCPSIPARAAQLRQTMDLEAERIFRLLGILYPKGELDSAYAAMRSSVPTARDSALELLEQTVDPQLRRLLVPLFDHSLTLRERARLANHLLGEISGEKPLVLELGRDGVSWLRAVAPLAKQRLQWALARGGHGQSGAAERATLPSAFNHLSAAGAD
jgi:AAA family ATP:ADP antiporter